MKRMIKLKLVNPTSPEADATLAVSPCDVKLVIEASSVDRRHRPEINSIIYTSAGPMAVRETIDFIIDKVNEANL